MSVYIFLKDEEFSNVIPAIIILGPLARISMYYYNIYTGEIPFRGIIQRTAIDDLFWL